MKQLKTLTAPLLCGALILIGMATEMSIFYVAAIIIGGYGQTVEGLVDSFTNRRLNIELLMIASAIGACILGDFKEGAILIFIFSFAGGLETLTLDRSQRDIQALLERQPKTALRLNQAGQQEEIPVEAVELGDRLLVLGGSSVAVDGTIVEGQSSFEESSITGESMPRPKGSGETVYGGTLNLEHPIVMRVDAPPQDMVLKRIVRMVEEAQAHQSPLSSFIERVEGKVALVLIVAVIVTILVSGLVLRHPWSEAFYKGIVLLVVASPCALVASVTPATLAAISNASRNGLLVKGGAYFEGLQTVDLIAFDKTGTLTQGKPQVVASHFETLTSMDQAVLRQLESQSSHPLAQAIVTYLSGESAGVKDIQEIKGQGVLGWYEGHEYRIGSAKFCGATINQDCTATQVFAAKDGVLLGSFEIADALRPEARSLISWLDAHGIASAMITGDRPAVANRIAQELGIQHVMAEALPDQKAQIVESFKERFGRVVMIGDGINDAPALAQATIGIAMGNGADIAIESADIVMTSANLQNIRTGIELAMKLKRVTRQNVSFALGVIVTLVCLNFMNRMTLPLGVVLHEGSTILVIMNGLRMLHSAKIDDEG